MNSLIFLDGSFGYKGGENRIEKDKVRHFDYISAVRLYGNNASKYGSSRRSISNTESRRKKDSSVVANGWHTS